MRRKRSYTEEFRRLAVARMKGCRNVSALAEELDVPRRLLYRWQMRLEGPVAPQEIYRWDNKPAELGEPNRSSSPAHPIDESPTSYSLAGCSPAEPDSASPVIDYPQGEAKP